MIFLVAALLVMGLLLGSVVHVPVQTALIAAACIGGWLLVFAARERRARHHRS
ncbi:hypothetical protein ACIOJD_16045 [Streptomyces sp. NPDC088116]|uniref:hypothetical protein n=1 Tax=Streptomyces sp. NPDC088116 TaxID=3365825 RepID=UPI003814C89A